VSVCADGVLEGATAGVWVAAGVGAGVAAADGVDSEDPIDSEGTIGVGEGDTVGAIAAPGLAIIALTCW
jgi:hypothetical protein